MSPFFKFMRWMNLAVALLLSFVVRNWMGVGVVLFFVAFGLWACPFMDKIWKRL